jgi:hypothetical protein
MLMSSWTDCGLGGGVYGPIQHGPAIQRKPLFFAEQQYRQYIMAMLIRNSGKSFREQRGAVASSVALSRIQALTDVATSNIFEVVQECVLSRGLRDMMGPVEILKTGPPTSITSTSCGALPPTERRGKCRRQVGTVFC